MDQKSVADSQQPESVTNNPAAKKSSIGWRPDIDGLRALAVFAVFAFHAFPKLKFLKGGFVGVDVFFAISGFLISSIIYTQLSKGTFSFWDFYSRRIYPVLEGLSHPGCNLIGEIMFENKMNFVVIIV